MWNGYPLVRQAEFELTMTGNTDELFQAVQTEREWRLKLAEGQKWPDECKRGRKVDFEISWGDGEKRFTGTVKFRRLNTLVLVTGA